MVEFPLMQPESIRSYSSPQSQVPDSVRAEASTLLALTAFREETTEERSRRNAALREMLASASNHAIAIARKMGGLTEREFWKRMEAGQNFPIDLLLDLACTLVTTSPAKKKTGQKLEAITQAIARYAPSAQGDEVVAALDYFRKPCLAEILFYCPSWYLPGQMEKKSFKE